MTTTVKRNEAGAVQRIPSGALRKTREHLMGDSVAAFCNESSGAYWNSGNHPESPENIAARALWNADVVAFDAAIAALTEEEIFVSPQIFYFPDSHESSVLKPPNAPYPTGLVVKAMLKFPSLERFSREVTEMGTFVPSVFLVDHSGSMREGGINVVQPGMSEYVQNPPTQVVPRVDVHEAESDERWLYWLLVELEALVP